MTAPKGGAALLSGGFDLAALEKDTDKALSLLRKAQAAGFAPAAQAIESVESLRKAPTGVRFVAQ